METIIVNDMAFCYELCEWYVIVDEKKVLILDTEQIQSLNNILEIDRVFRPLFNSLATKK